MRAQSIQNSLLHPFLSHLVMWRVCLFAFLDFFTMLNWVWMQRKFWNSIQAHFLYSFIIVLCVCVCVVPLLLPDTRSTLHKTESRKICCLFLFICFVLLLEFNSISLSRKWTYNNYSRECAWQVPCMPVLFFFILSFQRINSWSDCTEERKKQQ